MHVVLSEDQEEEGINFEEEEIEKELAIENKVSGPQ